MSKKRKQSDRSLANLKKGRCGPAINDRLRSSEEQIIPVVPEIPVFVQEPRFKDVGTTMQPEYDRANPSAATRTKMDVMRDQVSLVQPKLAAARQLKPRTKNEKLCCYNLFFQYYKITIVCCPML